MDSYQVQKSETLLETPVFHITCDHVLLPNGCASQRFIVQHSGAVIVIPQDAKGMLYLVRQYRHAVGKHLLEFPAGTLEKGEEPFECAQREICEEVGQGAREWLELGVLYPAPGFCTEMQHAFVAKDLYPKKLQGDDDEILQVEKLSLEGVKKAIVAGEICDAKSIAIFTQAQLRGLL